jgi:hypothetical protein
MPVGYRRCFAMYFSDADIDNGGFQAFYHSSRSLYFRLAIEGYERIGATRLVEILKSSFVVCLKERPGLVQVDRLDLPKDYLSGFKPLAETLDALEAMYYAESDRLPGAVPRSSYPTGPIAYYAEKFPEDFTSTENGAMNEDRFWRLIEESRTKAKPKIAKGVDVAGLQEKALEEVLNPLTPGDLAAFDRHFHRLSLKAYRWDLWAAAYWIGGGCSDDGFMDFRANLVSLAKEAYERVLADPNALADVVGRPDTPDLQAEGIGYVAARLHEKKTGKRPPDDPEVKFPENPAGEEFDFDDDAEMRRRLPKLTARVPMGS